MDLRVSSGRSGAKNVQMHNCCTGHKFHLPSLSLYMVWVLNQAVLLDRIERLTFANDW